MYVFVRSVDFQFVTILAYRRRNAAYRTRSGDKDVLSNKLPHQSRMRRISESVKKRNDILVKTIIYFDDISLRYAKIFRKCSVPIHTDAARIPAPLYIAAVAIAAVTACYVPLAADTLSNVKMRNPCTEGRNFTDVFVSDYRRTRTYEA